LAQEKCIKQLALNAEKNAKFLSNQQKASQFIAENVTLREHLEDSSASFEAVLTIYLFFIFVLSK
jgi:hypothetical protein